MGRGITSHRIRRIEEDLSDINGDGTDGSSTLDHGLLLGLTDDDHSQYAEIAAAETITADWTHTGRLTINRVEGAGTLWTQITGVGASSRGRAFALTSYTTGNMADGFGPGLVFSGTDATDSGIFGYFWCVRNGGDDDGRFIFSPATGFATTKDVLEIFEAGCSIDGDLDVTGNVTYFGIVPTTIDTTDSPYAASSGEVILVDTTTGNVLVNLPNAAASGFVPLTIKKLVSANTVVIGVYGSQTLDGDLTKNITTQYDALKVAHDGSNWFII